MAKCLSLCRFCGFDDGFRKNLLHADYQLIQVMLADPVRFGFDPECSQVCKCVKMILQKAEPPMSVP